MHPILLTLGPVSIKTYGLFIVIGFFAAFYYVRKRGAAIGLPYKFIYDLSFWSLVSGIIGARIAYVAIDIKYYMAHPLEIFMVWQGGLVFYGGLAAGIIGGVIVTWSYRIPNWRKVADIVAPGVALAHALGRIGCFFAGCCYGKPTQSMLGFVFSDPQCFAPLGVKLFPSQLAEAAGDFVIFLFLNKKLAKQERDGDVFVLYIFLYSLMRFFLEFLRGDFRGKMFAGLSTLQLIALVITIGLSVYYIRGRKNNAGK